MTTQTPRTGDRVRMTGLMDDPTPLPIGNEDTSEIPDNCTPTLTVVRAAD